MIVTKELLRLHEEKRVADAEGDDARMARALWWLRDVSKIFPVERHEHLPAIEEAIAAYDPNCGGRTVRVVDDAMVEAVWNALDPNDVPGLTRRKLRAALLAAYQQDKGGQQG